jgi:high-affinity iron transporter
MGASFLITLREGLEISLVPAIVLAIVLAYLATTGRRRCSLRWPWEPHCCIAAAVLTWMIFWMRKNARGMSAELHGKLDVAASSSATAVGLLGLAVSAVLGVMVYRGGSNLNLRRFFQITGALLILFAAGLFAKAVHEFRELLGVEGWLAEPSWVLESGPFASGWFYDFLAGVFGWSSDPERVRVIAYFAYLVPVSIAFFAGGRRSTTSTTTTGTPTPQVPASV